MKYDEVRAMAQARANETGFDHGVEKTSYGYRYFLLPEKRNRFGHELRCEVVMCENLDCCQPGHGPTRNE